MTSNSEMSDEEKNWNDLPAEMKLECIKRMDLPTRWALHYTSHSEKELVESTKWHGELMLIDSWDKSFLSCYSSKFRIELDHENHASLESLLRIGKFEYLRINCNRPSFKNFLAIFLKTACSVQRLYMLADKKDHLEILKNLKNCKGLESLVIGPLDKDDITFRKLLNDYEVLLEPILANTKYVSLEDFFSIESEDVIQLIEKWIADDQQLGWEFEIDWKPSSRWQVDIFEGLKSAFAERFPVLFSVELDEQELYISFKEDKHILVRISRCGSATLKVVDNLPT